MPDPTDDHDATGGDSFREPGRNRRQKVVGGVLIVVAAGFAVAVLASQWHDVRDSLELLSVGGVAIAAVASVTSVGASFLAWRATLAGLGSSLPMKPAARIFFLGQLGKYVPGSVWAIVGQMELGRAAGVRRDRMATAGLLVLAISLAVALGLGAFAAPALIEAGGWGYSLLILLVVPLAVLLHPRILGPLLDRVFRRLKRPPLEHRPDGRTVIEVAALSVVSNGLLGVQVWALATDVGATGWRVLPLAVGGYALAAAAGLLAIPVPAGAGVRELVLVLALSPVLDVGGATLVALLSRALLTVTDLVTAGAAATTARPGPARPRPGSG